MLAHGRLSELADDNSKNQEDQNGDDGDGDYLIRSHSGKSQLSVVGRNLLDEEDQHYLRAICFNVLLLLSV